MAVDIQIEAFCAEASNSLAYVYTNRIASTVQCRTFSMMGPAPVQNLFIWSSSADEALAAATSLVEAALAWQHYAYQERM